MTDEMFLGSKPNRPVVALDIDGTLSKYHEWFTAFARMYTGRQLSAVWRPEFRGEFNLALGLEKAEYRDIKLAYRQGGMKRSMPVFNGARDLVDAIHEAGAEVWFCTTRPWQRLDNIDPDTREHFRRQRLRFNGLIYGEHKYQDLVDIVGLERIVCALDDLPEMVMEAAELGVPALLRSQPHNEWWLEPDHYGHVMSLKFAEVRILGLIEKWKAQNA